MKFLLEFARFKDVSKTFNKEINKLINKEFDVDTKFINNVYLEDINKNIAIDWNHKNNHSIIDRIKNRTSINSISEFNQIVDYGIKQIFPDEIGKTITESGRYALHFNTNKFYLIVSLNYNRLFDDDAEIFMVTLTTIVNNLDVIEIYE